MISTVLLCALNVAHAQSCGSSLGDDYSGSFTTSSSNDRCFIGGPGPGQNLGTLPHLPQGLARVSDDGGFFQVNSIRSTPSVLEPHLDCTIYSLPTNGYTTSPTLLDGRKRGHA